MRSVERHGAHVFAQRERMDGPGQGLRRERRERCLRIGPRDGAGYHARECARLRVEVHERTAIEGPAGAGEVDAEDSGHGSS